MLKASAFLIQSEALLESHCERIWKSLVLNLRAGSRQSTGQVKTQGLLHTKDQFTHWGYSLVLLHETSTGAQPEGFGD